MSVRFGAWLGALGLLGLACAGYALATPEFDSPHSARVLCFAAIGACGLAAVFLQPSVSGKGKWRPVFAIWIPALLARLLLFPSAPSDDVNRYLWEGKLVAAGESPYARTADAPEWAAYRDGYWEAMNHKDKPTAYPPLALGAFALVGALWYHPMAFKLAFVLADLLTLGAVLRLLRRRGLSVAYAGLYSLNPLVLIAYAGEAHFDAIMIAPLVWSLAVGGPSLRAGRVALSAGVKWMTGPLLPFLLCGGAGTSVTGGVLPGFGRGLRPPRCSCSRRSGSPEHCRGWWPDWWSSGRRAASTGRFTGFCIQGWACRGGLHPALWRRLLPAS